MVEPARGSLELHIERFGEVLAEEVRRAGLERLVVLHQRLHRVRAHRAGELLAVRLHTRQHRHRHPLFLERAVHAEHAARFGLRLRFRGVGRVTLLPQELGGPEEQPRAQLPAHDVAPLVHQNRQIAIALNPLGEHRIDDRLGRRPHHQRLLQGRRRIDHHGARAGLSRRLETRVGHEGHLLGEALHVLRFLGQEALRNEQREVGVAVARRLEHVVQGALHQLPNAVAVGADHHAAADRRIVRQLGLHDDVVVPGAEVLRARRDSLCLRHVLSDPVQRVPRALVAHVARV